MSRTISTRILDLLLELGQEVQEKARLSRELMIDLSETRIRV
jgi:hypothetical protein